MCLLCTIQEMELVTVYAEAVKKEEPEWQVSQPKW